MGRPAASAGELVAGLFFAAFLTQTEALVARVEMFEAAEAARIAKRQRERERYEERIAAAGLPIRPVGRPRMNPPQSNGLVAQD